MSMTESKSNNSANNNSQDNSLNILFVFGCPLIIGGHIKSALAMAKNLRQRGHNIFVMAVPDGDKEIEKEFTAIVSECIFEAEIGKYWKFPAISGYRKIIKICREKSIDIIHAQDVCSTGRSYLAAVILKIPFIFTQPGGPVTHHIPPADGKIVLFSEELVEHFQKIRKIKKENIHLISARIDTTIYRSITVDSQFLEKYALPKTGIKIIMALRLIPQKSFLIDTMLETAEKIIKQKKDIHFIVAGGGSLLDYVRNRTGEINKSAGCKDAIKLIGNIESSIEMNNLYNYADIVIGHGRGILEAMACGKSVIILGENGKGEFLKPENVEEIAYYNFSGRHFRNRSNTKAGLSEVIERFLKSPDERFVLEKFSAEYIRSKMDAQFGAGQLLEIYRKTGKEPAPKMFSYFHWYVRSSIAVIFEGFKRLFNFYRLL